jgi:hypothetical protein
MLLAMKLMPALRARHTKLHCSVHGRRVVDCAAVDWKLGVHWGKMAGTLSDEYSLIEAGSIGAAVGDMNTVGLGLLYLVA